MRGISILTGAAFIALAGCNQTPSAVGTYMDGDNTGQMMVQITSVSGHEIKGMMTAAFNSEKGKVGGVSFPLTGTIDSNLVTFNVETGRELKLFTGTLTGDGLTLTNLANGNAIKWNLKRGDAAEFANRVQGVRIKAAELKEAAQMEAASAADAKRRAMLDERLVGDQGRIDSFAKETLEEALRLADDRVAILRIASTYGRSDARQDWVRADAQREHERVNDVLETLNQNSQNRKRDAETLGPIALLSRTSTVRASGLRWRFTHSGKQLCGVQLSVKMPHIDHLNRLPPGTTKRRSNRDGPRKLWG